MQNDESKSYLAALRDSATSRNAPRKASTSNENAGSPTPSQRCNRFSTSKPLVVDETELLRRGNEPEADDEGFRVSPSPV